MQSAPEKVRLLQDTHASFLRGRRELARTYLSQIEDPTGSVLTDGHAGGCRSQL